MSACRAALGCVVLTLLFACDRPDPALIPDSYLQAELGLTPDDRVHSIRLGTGVAERTDPDSVSVLVGDLVQFVTEDWLVHHIRFELDEADEAGRAFLVRTGQTESPPMVEQGSRFVLTFAEAPPGRYPYRLEGNREPGNGLIVVVDPDAR